MNRDDAFKIMKADLSLILKQSDERQIDEVQFWQQFFQIGKEYLRNVFTS